MLKSKQVEDLVDLIKKKAEELGMNVAFAQFNNGGYMVGICNKVFDKSLEDPDAELKWNIFVNPENDDEGINDETNLH